MSRVLAVFVVLAVVALVLADDMYTTKWDNIKVEDILNNPRLREMHKKCLLGKDNKDCSEEGEALKSVIKDALETGCSKCSEKQKEGALTIIKWALENDKEGWNELKKKYDPTGEYSKKYEEEAKKHGISP